MEDWQMAHSRRTIVCCRGGGVGWICCCISWHGRLAHAARRVSGPSSFTKRRLAAANAWARRPCHVASRQVRRVLLLEQETRAPDLHLIAVLQARARYLPAVHQC